MAEQKSWALQECLNNYGQTDPSVLLEGFFGGDHGKSTATDCAFVDRNSVCLHERCPFYGPAATEA